MKSDITNLLAACLCVGLSGVALAQGDAYPSKPVTVIVPALPGGIADLGMRLIADRAAEGLGQPVIIQNRPGGGGGTAAALAVMRAAPDGYTLFQASASTHAVNKTLIADLPYDPSTDFQPVSLLYSIPTILAVSAKSPAQSPADLVALARKKPGGLFFLSPGIGTASHLAGEMLKTETGAPFVHVPHKSVVAALTDLVAGRADLFFTSQIAAAPFVKDGRLRILAITSPKRSKDLPDVPTMAEAGYPNTEIDFWFGLVAPLNTPDQAIRRLNDAFVKALARPDLVKALTVQGVTPVGSSPQEFAKAIVVDTARFGKVVKASGAKAD
jgi:tripartite-type tricarboxylate transporter receptor subunit TctC